MPYIKQEDRTKIDELNQSPKTAGELNYLFTKLSINYILDNGLSYQKLNDVVGALEGCKLELYRRMIAPYEDKKIIENGDVY
jgi:hypothetical protein